MHGLEEGWAWLARLLNNLPANVYTAVVLEAFLRVSCLFLYYFAVGAYYDIWEADSSNRFIRWMKYLD